MASPRAPKKPVRSGASTQQLLPGISDDITLEVIAPKLSLIDLYTMSLVSPAWWQANRSRQVYEARVRSHETETLAVLSFSPCISTLALGLYSTKGLGVKAMWEFPAIPGLKRGIPRNCECVTLDGKVYILQGSDLTCKDDMGKVFVMDLAEQTGWRRCASMGEARKGFGRAVKNGKIYVFGGTSGVDGQHPVEGSEVYDPNEDVWSPITAMPNLRCLPAVGFMGDEIVVHGGILKHFYPCAAVPLM